MGVSSPEIRKISTFEVSTFLCISCRSPSSYKHTHVVVALLHVWMAKMISLRLPWAFVSWDTPSQCHTPYILGSASHTNTHSEIDAIIREQLIDGNLLLLQFLNGVKGFRVAGGRKYLIKLEFQCLTLTQGPVHNVGTSQIQEQMYECQGHIESKLVTHRT